LIVGSASVQYIFVTTFRDAAHEAAC
jgi:hypothetical protein